MGEARSLGEVRSVPKGVEEVCDLTGIRRTVGVQHDDEVAGGGGEAAGKSVPLTASCLVHDDCVRAEFACDPHGVVTGPAVHQDYLRVRWQPAEDVGYVFRLVERWNNDANRERGHWTPQRLEQRISSDLGHGETGCSGVDRSRGHALGSGRARQTSLQGAYHRPGGRYRRGRFPFPGRASDASCPTQGPRPPAMRQNHKRIAFGPPARVTPVTRQTTCVPSPVTGRVPGRALPIRQLIYSRSLIDVRICVRAPLPPRACLCRPRSCATSCRHLWTARISARGTYHMSSLLVVDSSPRGDGCGRRGVFVLFNHAENSCDPTVI